MTNLMTHFSIGLSSLRQYPRKFRGQHAVGLGLPENHDGMHGTINQVTDWMGSNQIYGNELPRPIKLVCNVRRPLPRVCAGSALSVGTSRASSCVLIPANINVGRGSPED
ncbi:hypothetical protein AG1IA_00564 [Rhizoctonia solani AG-1 IA]|uniref:Uncharacterized protein n=1 Tax=Thanatephorus cucumeris (strain AG1-IA) TaxID=983506 RepID=L8X9R2_THACA|nr:hypothetical protein AG1IA_00564 [Rhizoctonia solani AG-1 IA]